VQKMFCTAKLQCVIRRLHGAEKHHVLKPPILLAYERHYKALCYQAFSFLCICFFNQMGYEIAIFMFPLTQ